MLFSGDIGITTSSTMSRSLTLGYLLKALGDSSEASKVSLMKRRELWDYILFPLLTLLADYRACAWEFRLCPYTTLAYSNTCHRQLPPCPSEHIRYAHLSLEQRQGSNWHCYRGIHRRYSFCPFCHAFSQSVFIVGIKGGWRRGS